MIGLICYLPFRYSCTWITFGRRSFL